MEKLASIQQIIEVKKHSNADSLDLIKVLGWGVVTRIGEFKVGDKCVYVEIDSVLPKTSWTEFLVNKDHPEKPIRIKTKKLRGALSQGICFPLSILDIGSNYNVVWQNKDTTHHKITVAKDEIRVKIGKGLEHDLVLLKVNVAKILKELQPINLTLRGKIDFSQDYVTLYSENADEKQTFNFYKEGDDVTEILGIKKYEVSIPESLQGQVKGVRPGFIFKTDESRIQAFPGVIEELKGKPYYISEKVNGTSSSFFFVKDKMINEKESEELNQFGVCSRNLEMKEGECIYWKLAKKYNIEEKLKSLGKNIVIQGEAAGVGVQENPLNLKEAELFVFNILDIDSGKYLDFEEFSRMCGQLDLPMVRIVEKGDSFNYTQEELLEKAKGKYEGTNNEREGIVIRPQVEMYSETLKGRLSFKVVNNEHLLEEE